MRVLRIGSVLGIGLFCILLLTVRLVIFPHLESNRGDLTALLTHQLGQPVEADSLATGWDGWNPRLVVRGFRILDRKPGPPIFSLPEVRMTVAWTSLIYLELRLKELVIDQPTLIVQRDAQGMLHLAGQTIDPSTSTEDDGRLVEWLMRQPNIVVLNGAITWRDARRDDAPLDLTKVTLHLENGLGRHRFGLTGVPPGELASPLDVRGDVTGINNTDWRGASGRIYARLDYVDVAAWRTWVPMPIPIKSGKGGVRVWIDIARGEFRQVVADVVLADVQASLASDVAELGLARLEGRVGWRTDSTRREFYTQRLAFVGHNGARFDPTDFKLVLNGETGDPTGGQLEFDNLDLRPLRLIAASLPLPARWRDNLSLLEPRGSLNRGRLQWSGDLLSPKSFSGETRFVDFGIAAHESRPGIAGLTGNIDATQAGGTLKLTSRDVKLEMRRVFTDPLVFDSVEGAAHWRRDNDNLILGIDHLSVANADLAGAAAGEYRTESSGPGSVDLSAQLSRLDGRTLYRYMPLAGQPVAIDWLRTSIVAGSATDAKFKVKGNLAEFPFADGKRGQFQMSAKIQGVTLDYAAQWPRLNDVSGEVHSDGAHLVVDGHSATIFATKLNHIRADLIDFRVANPIVQLDGEAQGPMSDVMRFIAESPVDGWIDHAIDNAEVSGDGVLNVKFQMPLGKPRENRITGEYTFDGNRIKLGGLMPPVSQIRGKLAFTGDNVRTTGLTADILGGPANINFTASEGRTHAEANGTLNLAQLRTEYPQHLLASRMSGSTDWQLGLDVTGNGSTWSVDSSLRGAAIDLPLPIAKSPAATAALRVERKLTDATHDVLSIAYDRVARLTLHRRLTATGATPERGELLLGKAVGDTDRRGLWVRGDVDAVNLDEWIALKDHIASGIDTDALTLSGFDVTIGSLDIRGRQFSDLHIGANRTGDDWQLDLRGNEVVGSARWEAPEPSRPNGRVVARLQRLVAPPSAPAMLSNAETATTTTSKDNPWPALDIVADSFHIKNHDLGQLQLVAQPHERDWRIDTLKVSNDDGKLDANGWWRGGSQLQRTELDANLSVIDAGKYLARFGMPNAIRGGSTRINGTLAWSGGPEQFDYPSLGGSLKIESGPGQFTKIDPGVGKLLGVLSLQSLRRRLAFDFQDLFGEGFAFDDITGEVVIKDGVMKTDDLRINGSAAKVTISGETDIADETQKLKVRVQPSLSGSISVGAAALLLANPIVGAVVGAGSLLAQKVLQDPIEKMFSYEYLVTGSWSDAVVERVGRNKSANASDVSPATR
jgi:uncharacterized protein (TIGR02099 family)